MGQAYDNLVSDEQAATFWRDGVVCLRGVIPVQWLDILVKAFDQWQNSPNRKDFGAQVGSDPSVKIIMDESVESKPRGQFYTGSDPWRSVPNLLDFAAQSPLPHIVAQLLKSSKINLYEDSILVKEPGTLEKTAFHQDISYFHAEGHQICTTWVPLDPVTPETGALKFIRGSHLWKEKYRPNYFVSDEAIPGSEGIKVPDFHKDTRGNEVISFSTEPGDITIHHARTIHGADGNSSSTTRRRALSVRYCGDDARFKIRKAVPPKPHHAQMREGDVMDHDDCPIVWTAG